MREKLIELLVEGRHKCAYISCENCTVLFSRNCMDELLANHLIAKGVTIREWIPVTERLPDKKKVIDGEVYYRNVAVRVKNLLHERIAYYDPEHECWYDTGFFQIRGVTHWAELPDWEE